MGHSYPAVGRTQVASSSGLIIKTAPGLVVFCQGAKYFRYSSNGDVRVDGGGRCWIKNVISEKTEVSFTMENILYLY
jgi:hypothetical protein